MRWALWAPSGIPGPVQEHHGEFGSGTSDSSGVGQDAVRVEQVDQPGSLARDLESVQAVVHTGVCLIPPRDVGKGIGLLRLLASLESN